MTTTSLLALVGLVMVAAITPGPNNLIVLRLATAREQARRLFSAIGGIVLGGLVLLTLVAAGASTAFAAEPRLRGLITIAGCLYLGWLGLSLTLTRPDTPATRSSPLPAGLVGLTGFQFLNPKSWVLAMTAVAATPPAPTSTLCLFAAFALVPPPCLALWALSGRALAGRMQRPRFRRRFDRAMGLLLIASAAGLLLG